MTDDRNKPILHGDAATDYERYLRTDELLSLQKSPAEVVHRDEHLFQTVHQSSELWLKLAWLELDQAALQSREARRQALLRRLFYLLEKEAAEAAAQESDSGYRNILDEIAKLRRERNSPRRASAETS